LFQQRFGLNLRDFFSNCTFSETPPSFLACKTGVSDHWLGQPVNVLVLLTIFITVHFVFSIVCMTLPVPSGVFMPIFVLGAAIGRLMGEVSTFPKKEIHKSLPAQVLVLPTTFTSKRFEQLRDYFPKSFL
ncbi:hypothetical protein COOONC_18793, partial [Cooperia oncophora]